MDPVIDDGGTPASGEQVWPKPKPEPKRKVSDDRSEDMVTCHGCHRGFDGSKAEKVGCSLKCPHCQAVTPAEACGG